MPLTMSTIPWPTRRYPYGSHDEQFGELRAPETAPAPLPIAVLLHGGFWLSQWRLDLMDPLGDDLARRGVASWNVEYRRADRHGWPAMTGDVEQALRAIADLAERHPIDLTKIVLIGHSAGGQLAARVTADLLDTHAAVRPAAVVSLAGVLDLVEADRRDLGAGAIPAALGARAEESPELYARSSPIRRLPLGVPQVIVSADGDDADLNDMHRNYAATAQAAGDKVFRIDGPGDHFTLIDPRSRLWTDTVAVIGTLFAGGPKGKLRRQ